MEVILSSPSDQSLFHVTIADLPCHHGFVTQHEKFRKKGKSIEDHFQGFSFPLQKHTSRVLVLPRDKEAFLSCAADGCVTTESHLPIAVRTADCAPLLFYAPEAVGIAHAGWKGVKQGILEEMIKAMDSLKASSVRAIIGPTIRFQSYEVKKDFLQAMESGSPFPIDDFIHEKGERVFFDLPGYITKRLENQGCLVTDTGYDSFGPLFFSRRYSLSKNEESYGNTLAFIERN